jgi:hypothetical protein
MGGKRLKEEDWIGKMFGRLLVLGRYGRDEGPGTSGRLWRCLCSCGTYMETRLPALTSGHTKSCGCIQFEHISSLRKTHGGTSLSSDPGVQRAYSSWWNMRHRCQYEKHESYPRYGGRGIQVAPAWEDFETFLAEMGPCPEGYCLERQDNDKHYEKSNCTWWPKSLQQINTCRTIRLAYQGEEWCLKKLCDSLHLTYSSVQYRYRALGWDISSALLLPQGEVHELDSGK